MSTTFSFTVDFADFRNVIRDVAGNDGFLEGTRQADVIDGLDLDDIILAGRGADAVFGREGDDILRGERGADSLDGGEGNDEIDGGRGADLALGGLGDDTLIGGRGNDTLDGGAGIDVIEGGRGRDVIRTGEGDDISEGGRGRDSFVFADGESDGAETILDFSVRQDEIVLHNQSFGVSDNLLFQNVARVDAADVTNFDLVGIEAGKTVYVLQGQWNNAGNAADAIALALNEIGVATEEDEAAFFVYHNVNQGRNRLFQVDDVDDVNSGIQHIANLSDTGNLNSVLELVDFEADNFRFESEAAFA